MINDIKKVLVSENDILDICKRLGAQISNDYKDSKPVIIGLLKGCQPFMSDLLKHISIYCEIDYMDIKSYAGRSSTGQIRILKDINCNIVDRPVIIVDDIIDTGRTVYEITKLLKARHASSVEVCALLDKPEGRLVDVKGKYIGSNVPKEFVVGYGLDYNEFYRNLPFIGVLKEEIYKD